MGKSKNISLKLIREKLFDAPEVRKALLEMANGDVVGSRKQLDWVVAECFSNKRKEDFVEEATDAMDHFAYMVDSGMTKGSMNEYALEKAKRLATIAAIFYLRGAAAGAMGIASVVERQRKKLTLPRTQQKPDAAPKSGSQTKGAQ